MMPRVHFQKNRGLDLTTSTSLSLWANMFPKIITSCTRRDLPITGTYLTFKAFRTSRSGHPQK